MAEDCGPKGIPPLDIAPGENATARSPGEDILVRRDPRKVEWTFHVTTRANRKSTPFIFPRRPAAVFPTLSNENARGRISFPFSLDQARAYWGRGAGASAAPLLGILSRWMSLRKHAASGWTKVEDLGSLKMQLRLSRCGPSVKLSFGYRSMLDFSDGRCIPHPPGLSQLP